MDIRERSNRVVTWCLTNLLVVPACALLMQALNRTRIEPLFAAIILSSLLGVAVFWLFGLLGRLAVGAWYQPERDTG